MVEPFPPAKDPVCRLSCRDAHLPDGHKESSVAQQRDSSQVSWPGWAVGRFRSIIIRWYFVERKPSIRLRDNSNNRRIKGMWDGL